MAAVPVSNPALATAALAANIQPSVAAMEQQYIKPVSRLQAISSHAVVGPNLSFIHAADDPGELRKQKPGIGFQAGWFTRYDFGNDLSFSPGLLFKHNRASEETNVPGEGMGGGYRYETDYAYNFLSAPMLADFAVSQNFHIMAGPELNYLLGASMKTSGGEKVSLTDNSVRFGIGLQAGIHFQALPAVGIQLQYDHRLSRLNKKAVGNGDYQYDVPAMKMQSIQVSVTCALCELLGRH